MSRSGRTLSNTRPPRLIGAGERQMQVGAQYVAPTLRTATAPLHVVATDSHALLGNLDEVLAREKARLAGEVLPRTPEILPQKTGLLDLLLRFTKPALGGKGGCA